jgi:ethanolamine utilization protein
MKTKITSNILEDISKRLLGGNNQGNGERVLVVFTGSNIYLDNKIEEIRVLKNKGMKISLGFSFMAEQILDTQKITNILSPNNIYKEQDIVKLKEITRNYSALISPNITINTISKISLGMIDSFIPNLIWTFMYQGKNVYIDFEGIRNYLGEKTNNKEILNQINTHIETVKKMGAIEIEDNKYTDNIVIGVKDENIKLNPRSQENTDKKVITEKDILNISSNSNLVLPKGTIITHLARDKALAKNIKIEIK